MMKNSQRLFRLLFLLLAIVVVIGSYFYSFPNCENKLHIKIDNAFNEEAPFWGEAIMRAKGIPYLGRYDTNEYANKKKTTLLSAEDTIVISSMFYHPKIYLEYQRKNGETSLLLYDDYDIRIADSLLKTVIIELDITAESSVELKVRDLSDMFPTADSMNADVPFVKTFSSGSVEGHIIGPVGVGICDHALLYGHVKIPFSTILLNMEWFGVPQIVAIILFVFLYFTFSVVIPRFRLYLKFRQNVVFLGNTCIDLSRKELYLWSGECRHITDIRFKLVEMIVASAPTYQLSKEKVCRTIWNRNAKDGQALYNVAMTDMRTLFITEDPALELKSMPREGMQLLVNSSRIKIGRTFRFLWFYLEATSKRERTGEEQV